MVVFLSYRHEENPEHPDHQARVVALGERLQAESVEVVLDQLFSRKRPGGPDEGWPKWCEDRVQASEKILIVASKGYFECYEGKQSTGTGLGAAWEANIIRNILYKNSKSEKFRIVYFDKSHISELPDSLFHIPRFDATNQNDLKNIIGWLKGNLDPAATEQILQPKTIWPAAVSGFKADLANRESEFSFFKDLLAGKTAEQAIFFEGKSNQGKTRLVRECISYANRVLAESSFMPFDFKGNPTRDAVLDAVSVELGSRLPSFSKTGELRELRRDLRVVSTPLLLLFDTYEQASAEARELVQNVLLADLEKTQAVRIIIAGQEVPDYRKALWVKLVRPFPLGPIRDFSSWADFARQRYPHLKLEEIKTIATATRGDPGVTWSFIETFAQDSSG